MGSVFFTHTFLFVHFNAATLSQSHSAPVAYAGGTFGVILGADILRLNSIRSMGVAFVSIGGAGTFDGVFLAGIIAVLLA